MRKNRPAKAQAKAPSTNDKVIAGPAFTAAACPVSTKMPAPMIAPMPSETRLTAERVRLSGTPSWVVSACTSGSAASASSAAIDLRVQIFAMAPSVT